jgi:predicted phosphoadenosine phosphosulfate sulfurtransferase
MARTLSKQHVASDVVQMARERTRHCYDVFDRVAVSFSGGKDSTVILNLALEVARERRRLPLDAVFFDEEAIPPETVNYVTRVMMLPDIRLRWLCLPVKHRNGCSRKSPFWRPFDPACPELWCRQPPEWAITSLPGFQGESIPRMNHLLFDPAQGSVGILLGLRADESLNRFRSVAHKERDNYISWEENGFTAKCKPIYDWQTEDVWLAPHRFGWDYNCNAAEAPIWMGDYTFRPIGQVRAGDEVIGWAREGTDRTALIKARILAVHSRISRIVKVSLESGQTIRCTPDHRWSLLVGPAKNSNWEFNTPAVGKRLARVVKVPPSLNPGLIREAAWLGGIYDGEGSWDRLYQNPKQNPRIHQRIGEVLQLLGIPATRLNEKSPAQNGWRISGGREGLLRFVNFCRPERREQFDRYFLTSRFRTPDRILAIEEDGVDEVFALTTSTGNYIAWGYGSSNSAYDRMEQMGLPRRDQRVAPPFGEEPMRNLRIFQVCWPELWDKMSRRVPGAATAARYATTSLYHFGQRNIQKLPGMTWKEMIEVYLERHSPDVRTKTAHRIKKFIKFHEKRGIGPIPDQQPCPYSGVSWKFLATIACRGDVKGRRSVQYGWKEKGLAPPPNVRLLEAMRTRKAAAR